MPCGRKRSVREAKGASVELRKKAARGRARGGGKFFQGAAFHLRRHFRNLLHVSRLTAFSSVRQGGKVRAIGFQHEFLHRRGGQRVADVLGIFASQNAGEAYQ